VLTAFAGFQFAKTIKKNIMEVAGDTLTVLQELVLDGDVETAQYQIEREIDRAKTAQGIRLLLAFACAHHIISSAEKTISVFGKKEDKDANNNSSSSSSIVKSFQLNQQNSLMQFAVLNGQKNMIQMLLDCGGTE
jgi:hypothetical protein